MAAITLAVALPALAASPPSCLKVSVDDNRRSDTVTVRNTRSTPYAVKVVWTGKEGRWTQFFRDYV